jgi:lysophospholipase L1-like esterase
MTGSTTRRDATIRMSRRTRLRSMLASGGLAIFVALAYVHFFLYLPMGSGPAGPAVEPATFKQPWSDRPVLLVGIGDSVTAGFGATKGRSYFERLVHNPPNEFPELKGICLSRVLPELKTLNLAVSGSNSLQHVSHIRDRLPRQDAGVFGLVVMTTGGNDLIHWYGTTPPREGAMYGSTLEQAQPWIVNYQQRLDDMLTLIEERFPGGCSIFVGDIYDPSDGIGDPQSTWALPAWPDCLKIINAYNSALRRVAAKHSAVHVVSVHDSFLGHGIHCRQFWRSHYVWRDPHYWYFENIEDPNDRGYDALRRIFLSEISRQRHLISAQGNGKAAAVQ